jgi:TetR/AcrR family transcriptional regulator
MAILAQHSMPSKAPKTQATARAKPPLKARPKAKAVTAAPREAARPSSRQPSPGASQRRRRLVENKRRVIIDAALGLFSRYGLHGTSLDQVAARADVSKSNLLYYFSSKEELYAAVLRDLLHRWLEPLRAFNAEQDPRTAIQDYIRHKFERSRDQPEASRLFCLEIIQGAVLLKGELEHALRALVDEKSAVVRQWVASGRLAEVDPHHLIFALWAITQHYADFAVQVQALTGKTLADPAFFEEAVANAQRLVLDGVGVRPRRR